MYKNIDDTVKNQWVDKWTNEWINECASTWGETLDTSVYGKSITLPRYSTDYPYNGTTTTANPSQEHLENQRESLMKRLINVQHKQPIPGLSAALGPAIAHKFNQAWTLFMDTNDTILGSEFATAFCTLCTKQHWCSDMHKTDELGITFFICHNCNSIIEVNNLIGNIKQTAYIPNIITSDSWSQVYNTATKSYVDSTGCATAKWYNINKNE